MIRLLTLKSINNFIFYYSYLCITYWLITPTRYLFGLIQLIYLRCYLYVFDWELLHHSLWKWERREIRDGILLFLIIIVVFLYFETKVLGWLSWWLMLWCWQLILWCLVMRRIYHRRGIDFLTILIIISKFQNFRLVFIDQLQLIY